MLIKHCGLEWVIGFALLLSARAYDYTPSRIDGLKLSNPTVGFHGFAVEFPGGYAIYPPPADPKSAPPTFGYYAYEFASRIDEISPGWHTEEAYAYTQPFGAIGFSVSSVRDQRRPFSQWQKNDLIHFMRRNIALVTPPFPHATKFMELVDESGNAPIAKIGFKSDKLVYVAYYVPGTLREFFNFLAICAPRYQDLMVRDLDRAVATLKTK